MRRPGLALLLLAAVPAIADSNLPPSYWAYRQLPDAGQEAKAQALMEELRSVVGLVPRRELRLRLRDELGQELDP